jgi:hypothetical protein
MLNLTDFFFIAVMLWGFYAFYLLQKDKSHREWNPAYTVPDDEGEYWTLHMIGKIETIEKAIWNGQKWVQSVNGRIFECYRQDREWKVIE